MTRGGEKNPAQSINPDNLAAKWLHNVEGLCEIDSAGLLRVFLYLSLRLVELDFFGVCCA